MNLYMEEKELMIVSSDEQVYLVNLRGQIITFSNNLKNNLVDVTRNIEITEHKLVHPIGKGSTFKVIFSGVTGPLFTLEFSTLVYTNKTEVELSKIMFTKHMQPIVNQDISLQIKQELSETYPEIKLLGFE